MPVLVSAAGPLSPGPLRVLCERRSSYVVSLVRALGRDERPDLRVEWTACSLRDRQHGRLGLLEGDYDSERHVLREPRYRTVSVPEARALAPEVDELMAAQDARWARSSFGHQLADLARAAVLPGPGMLDSLLKQLAPGPDDRMPPEIVGPNPPAVRPELLLALTAAHRRHPELFATQDAGVRARLRLALDRMSADERRRHAAAAAHAAWAILDDRPAALALLAEWAPDDERLPVGAYGLDVLGLPPELVFAHLATREPDDAARELLRGHLLAPLAHELDLAEAVPLPAALHPGGRPRLDPRWSNADPEDAARAALVAQFDDWTRVGPALVSATAGAGVDRMPMVGTRPPDPRGVRAALHVLNDSAEMQRVEAETPTVRWADDEARAGNASAPTDIPAQSATTIQLGALDDEPLEPERAFAVALAVRIGGARHEFALEGKVSVVW
ncbi:MAG: hypothetical protein M3141_01060 [Actinomycetota bacterium]|nr:hypothetical protein [Actinomycetota bacterium]